MRPSSHLRIEPNDMLWAPTDVPGIECKPLATAVGVWPHDVQIWRIAPGASLPTLADDVGFEAIVLEGRWDLPQGSMTTGGYARRPPGRAGTGTSADGATLFVRTGRMAPGDEELVHLPSEQRSWLPGQGNLRVQPLHAHGDAGTALVHWPAGERFQPHRHQGGEEVLVLSGTFEDEHGRYPRGTWLLSPHLSTHHPFVTVETVIFVKTGHLPRG